MPFIQFTRDRRGYEHTCIVHASRRRGRKEARLLYWFRTPPNVKVGRAPIDEAAIHAIEQSNPDLTFDWPRILDARPAPPAPEPAGRPPRRRREGEGPERAARPRSTTRPAPPAPGPTRSPRDVATRVESPRAGSKEEVEEADEAEEAVGVPEATGGETVRPPVPESARPVPAEALVGVEGLARLRTLYAELQARITERGAEPARVEELRREAERLNPDAWVTLEEARRALEQYEIVSDTFRRALGRRRRSRRGGVRRSRRQPATGPDEPASQAPAEAGGKKDFSDETE